jgi:hypothetical protein
MSAAQVLDENGNGLAHTFQIGDDPRAARPVQVEPDPVVGRHRVVTQPAKPIKRDPSASLSTRELLAQLKTRLREVEREIKLRQRLEEERGQLKRLISAAKLERDNVRRLRSAG